MAALQAGEGKGGKQLDRGLSLGTCPVLGFRQPASPVFAAPKLAAFFLPLVLLLPLQPCKPGLLQAGMCTVNGCLAPRLQLLLAASFSRKAAPKAGHALSDKQ